jgi:hypothetical protein
LTKLAAEGIETLPVANTWDGHGKYVNHLCKGEVSVVVGYLHKIIPAQQERASPADLLFACKILSIPVLLIAPATLRDKAKKILGEAGPNIHIVAPEELEAQISKYL